MFTLFLIILILVAVAMVTAILLQAGTGGGLAAMTTILTKATWWLGGIFLGLSLLLAGMSTRTSVPRSVLDSEPVAPAPIVPPTQLPLNVEPEQSQGTTPPQPQN
jgi:preprotein translocase subunit SecG